MTTAHCYLFKRSFEFLCCDAIDSLPARMRGIYVLYQETRKREGSSQMNVVYVGMARGERSGVKGRLRSHLSKKTDLWSHCSVFEVWDNISAQQVQELEGMFRHLYRRDAVANKLNKQKAYAPLRRLAQETKASFTNAL